MAEKTEKKKNQENRKQERITSVVATSVNQRSILKVIFFLALVIIGTYLVIHYNFYHYLTHREEAIMFLRSFHPYDGIIFILLQILQVVVAPIPGEATGIIGGLLYGTLRGTVYSTIGLTIGSWIAFALAKTLGLPMVEKTVKPEILQKYDYVMEHKGILVSFILFLIPGFPKDCLCYILGMSHMRTWTFLIISTIGRLLGTILLTVTGSCAFNHQYKTLMVIGFISGVLILSGYLFHDRIQKLSRKRK